MMLGSFYYKLKAKEALAGNWQTAMLVAFFSSIMSTLLQVVQMLALPSQYGFATPEAYAQAVLAVPQSRWILLAVLFLLTLVITPVLGLGCNHYFIQRTRGNELGFGGLFSRMGSFGEALWLYLRMAVQIFLWSLLLIVPGIIAAIRYSMAPYYLADDPSIGASEALRRSKEAMAERKMNFFMLVVSFLGWTLLATMLQTYLCEVNFVLGTVAGLALQVWVAAYRNASVACFYRVVSQKGGVRAAYDELFGQLDEMGMDPETLNEMRQKAQEEMQSQEGNGSEEGQPTQPDDLD